MDEGRYLLQPPGFIHLEKDYRVEELQQEILSAIFIEISERCNWLVCPNPISRSKLSTGISVDGCFWC